MRESRLSRVVAAVLVVAVQGLFVPSQAGPATALLSGTIVSGEDRTPLAGARVHAADPRTGEIRSSEPTGPDGSFEVVGLPASTYEIGVEADGGLYLVGTPVALAPGRAQHLDLAVSQAKERAEPKKPYRGGRDESHVPSLWSNPLTAALIVLGAAVVVGLLVEGATDDSGTPASAATP